MELLSTKDEIRCLLQRRAKAMGFTHRAIEVLVKGSDGPRHCRPGGRIVAAGDCADYVRLLVQGAAKLAYAPAGTSRALVVRYFGPGDFLFLPPVPGPRPGRLEIVGHGDVSVATMTRAHVQEAIANMPASNTGQLVSWTARTGQHLLLRKMALLSCDVGQRIVVELAALVRPFGERVPDGWRLTLSLTHQDIADLVGCGRPAATRALLRLATKRLVAKQLGRYWIASKVCEGLSRRDAEAKAA